MAKGRFEADKGNARSSGRNDPYAVRNKPPKPEPRKAKLWPILAGVAGAAVLAVGVLILTKTGTRKPVPETTAPPSTVELQGMPRAELEQRFTELDSLLHRDLTLTLTPLEPEGEAPAETPSGTPAETAAGTDAETPAGAPAEEPIVLTLTQEQSGAGLDLTRLAADLDAGVGQERGDSFLLDPRDYLTLDEDALRAFAEEAAAQYGGEFVESSAALVNPEPEDLPPEPSTQPSESGEADPESSDEPATEEAPPKPTKVLVLNPGSVGRSITADAIFEALKNAYEITLIAEEPEQTMQPTLRFEVQNPAPLDAEALFKRYCKEPVDAELEPNTGNIKPGKDGFGCTLEELQEALANAEPGQELRLPLAVRRPEVTAEYLQEHLFKDVLGEAHTPHSAIYNRTVNLTLACEEIDGTIVMPGEIFSFNKTVGERTEEKGYREAIAYVSGGESKPEVGGGVCQVASSIYYAVLQADLKTVEREPHMFLVSYVPSGMDATIYWGYLDFKFENTSPYPIKIEASVSNGKVHITLLGTEWKDYTVELSYEVLSTEPWEEVELDVPNDGTYYKGEVITTPYTGYKVATFRTTRNRETGEEIEKTQIAISRYKKRDKVIANPTGAATAPTTEPTQPTQPQPTEPTQPPATTEAPPPATTEAPPPVTTEPPPPVTTEPPPPVTTEPPPPVTTEPPPPVTTEPTPSESGEEPPPDNSEETPPDNSEETPPDNSEEAP